MIGVLVTLAVVLAVPRILKSEGGADGFFRPKPNPDAQPAATNEDGEAIAPDTATDTAKPEADKPKQTQYDFYTLLPGEGVQVTDAELAASAKAEAEAQAKAAEQQATAGTDTQRRWQPADADRGNAGHHAGGIDGHCDIDGCDHDAQPPASTDDSRYLLQAGAFGASGDAETVKAKIAMLGPECPRGVRADRRQDRLSRAHGALRQRVRTGGGQGQALRRRPAGDGGQDQLMRFRPARLRSPPAGGLRQRCRRDPGARHATAGSQSGSGTVRG